jgi:exopolysaccharide production protein ExoQ
MASTIALLLWLILLLALLCFDPAREPGTSLALWVPLIWIFIVASRLPSQWLGVNTAAASQALEDGNPLDRAVLAILIALAIGILISRSFRWSAFFTRNIFLSAFLFFALISVCWSDFPLIALKRWFRDLGNYLVILVILSDPRPLEAVRTVLRRLGYLLVPLSIVLIKYYPWIGKQFDQWSGENYFVGVATSKNMLGAVCLVSGIFFFWDTVTRWSNRKERRARRIILVDLAFIAMTLWLLNLAGSATSGVCLAVGCVVILMVRSRAFKRQPSFFKTLISLSFPVYLILAFVFDLNGELAGAVGRNPTLTDRTLIWSSVLSLQTNPVFGIGYGSFWLGSRLASVWGVIGGINEAHNGYLEVYLDLGLIGLALIIGFLICSYRNISRELDEGSTLAPLSMAFWTVALFYNMTEAAFKIHLMWLALLLAALAIPARADEQMVTAASFGNAGAPSRFERAPLKSVSLRR